MKKLFKAIIVLVVLLLVGAVAIYIYLDQIAKQAIERGGTYALGVDTAVESARLGIFSGELNLSGVKVDNPQGFAADHFMEFDGGELAVSLGTLREDVIEIPRLALSDVTVALERGAGGTNYDVILQNLARFERAEPDPDAKRYVIGEVVISNLTVQLDLFGAAGGLSAVTLPIEEIRLEQVGSGGKERGVVMGELASIIVKAVMQVVLDKGGTLLPDDLQQRLAGRLSELESLSQIGVNLESVFSGDVGAIQSKIQERLLGGEGDIGGLLGDGLGNILGGESSDGDEESSEDDGSRERRRRDDRPQRQRDRQDDGSR